MVSNFIMIPLLLIINLSVQVKNYVFTPCHFLFIYQWFLAHELLEVWWNLEFTSRLFGSNFSVEQAGKNIFLFCNIFHVLLFTVMKFPLNLIGFLFTIIPSLIYCWWRALFLGFFFWESFIISDHPL